MGLTLPARAAQSWHSASGMVCTQYNLWEGGSGEAGREKQIFQRENWALLHFTGEQEKWNPEGR